MSVKSIESSINVVDAAKRRIKKAFTVCNRIYLSTSGGKDSLCLMSLIYDLILAGEIDRSKLVVFFIDEEGIYRSMEKMVMQWKAKFEKLGISFLWYCLPFKQVSVIDHLSATESWITWEPGLEDKWIRKPPKDAIMKSGYLQYPGQMNYQTFGSKAFNDGYAMIGLRAAESLQRRNVIANKRGGKYIYPIYDWKDTDVWKYIKDNNLDFPEIYIRMYENGATKREMRLCAFFGDNGVIGLRYIAETDPELWSRIENREPNAYLVLLYWESEMFRRKSRKRSKMEQEQEKKDYKSLVADMLFINPEKYEIPSDTKKNLRAWKNLVIKSWGVMKEKEYQRIYEGILFGDPKCRVLRAVWIDVYSSYAKDAKGGAK